MSLKEKLWGVVEVVVEAAAVENNVEVFHTVEYSSHCSTYNGHALAHFPHHILCLYSLHIVCESHLD